MFPTTADIQKRTEVVILEGGKAGDLVRAREVSSGRHLQVILHRDAVIAERFVVE